MSSELNESRLKYVDLNSEVLVIRQNGSDANPDQKYISIALKSNTETIEELLKKLPGVI